MIRLKIDEKYTVIIPEGPEWPGGARFEALRYGDPWRVLTGDNLVLAMAHRIIELEALVEKNQKPLVDKWAQDQIQAIFDRLNHLEEEHQKLMKKVRFIENTT